MKRADVTFAMVKIPLDAAMLALAGLAAFMIRNRPEVLLLRPIRAELPLDGYVRVMAAAIVIWLVVFVVLGLYSTRREALRQEAVRVFVAGATAMAVLFAGLFFFRSVFESRFIVLAGWALAIVFTIGGRMTLGLLRRFLYGAGVGVTRVALIGNTKTRQRLETELQRPHSGVSIIARFDTFDAETQKQIERLNREGKIDQILLADPHAGRQATLDALTFCETRHLEFCYAADLLSTSMGRPRVYALAGMPMIEVQRTPLEGWGAVLKRGLDLIGSSVLILLASPVMLATAIAIVAETGRPVFFSRRDTHDPVLRVGRHGRAFRYFKFRSMKPNTDSMRYRELSNQDIRRGSPLVKIKNDPRVTRVGRFIRRFSLDELPELLLVFIGKMSLVGPRPHLPEEVERYAPEHRKVLTIKPGITGMAQISGRSDLDFEEEVRLDTYYIEHWSPWLDLTILLKTPWAVLRPKRTEHV